MSGKAHFLSGIGGERRDKIRRDVKLNCQVYYLRSGLRGYAKRDATMLNISESGCLLLCPLSGQLPEHLYIIIEGIPFKFSCAVVGRKEDKLNTSFLTELPTEFVNKLVAARRLTE